MALDERCAHLHCGPFGHVAAAVRLFSVTQSCGRHVFLPKFQAQEVLRAIAAHGVTLATFVPTMLRAVLNAQRADPADLSTLRCITYGAAPMPESLLREAMDCLPGVDFVQSYGMTETSPIVTMLGAGEHRNPDGQRLRSAGRAALLTEVEVRGPDDRPLPNGETGEIVVRGPNVMLGYWKRPEATAQALRDGWMRTGDLGYLDDDGYLFVVDRCKDVIITGGENVYSQEVENVIMSHSSVDHCAVIGLPDEEWGESVHAVVVPVAGKRLDAQAIVAHCRSHLTAFKCPKSVTVQTAPLPLSGANKILKSKLRDRLAGHCVNAQPTLSPVPDGGAGCFGANNEASFRDGCGNP